MTDIPKGLFLGCVHSVVNQEAIVTLTNQATGEEIEAECDVAMLGRFGIWEGDEFTCDVIEDKGRMSVVLTRLEPKHLEWSRVEAILREAKDADIGPLADSGFS